MLISICQHSPHLKWTQAQLSTPLPRLVKFVPDVELFAEPEWEEALVDEKPAGGGAVHCFMFGGVFVEYFAIYDFLYENRIWRYKRYAPSTSGTERVGHFLPNSWGLYDMHGNAKNGVEIGNRQVLVRRSD